MKLLTQFVRDQDAFVLLGSKGFQQQWKNLARQTMWYSNLQEATYLSTWYIHYESVYEPILFYADDQLGNMVGLIGLAWHKKKRQLVHAGSAEYHGWLATEEASITFLRDVLYLIKSNLGIMKWSWTWMPSGLPISDLKAASSKGVSLILETRDSPIWNLKDGNKLNKLRKRRSVKSKFNRYHRRGKLHYEVIKDSARFKEVIKIVQVQCDFRREAINNCRPFAEDPNMVGFCANLLQFPDTLHASALWLDKQLLAYHMGILDGGRLSLGLISYDPSESRLSPGTLLIIKLADHLAQSGYEALDMTPGLNSYKDQFANYYETLYRPSIYFKKSGYLVDKIGNTLAKNVRRALIWFKMDLEKVRIWKTDVQEWASKLKELSVGKMISHLRNITLRKKSYYLYEIDLKTKVIPSLPLNSLERQDYASLLFYQAKQPFLTRRGLLSDALKKFSKGDVLYSKKKGEQLQWLGWLKESGKQHQVASFPKGVPISNKGKILYDLYVAPSVSSDVFDQSISEILSHLKAAGEEKLWLWMEAKDALSVQKMDHLGIISHQKFGHAHVLNLFRKNSSSEVCNIG